MSERLAGKRAIVTGATSGIGQGVVRRFVAEGARVAFCGRRAGPGEALAAELGAQARFFAADVTDAAQVERLVDEAAGWLGGVDCLFNNAAEATIESTFLDVTPTALDGAMRSVFASVVLVTGQVLPHMIATGGGSVINNGSTAAHRANSSTAIYSALKAGVCHLSRCLALEFADRAVRVNTISPGAVVTPIFIDQFAVDDLALEPALEAISRGFARVVPVGRGGRPADIASAAVFFASDESAYVTGQDLVVDGGLTAGLATWQRRAQVARLREALEEERAERKP